jgi:hypothetical protein
MEARVIEYTARASRHKDVCGPYFVQIGGIRDAGEMWTTPHAPEQATVKTWLAGILGKPEDTFNVRLEYDLGDAPPRSRGRSG